jgi:hypothetical protein
MLTPSQYLMGTGMGMSELEVLVQQACVSGMPPKCDLIELVHNSFLENTFILCLFCKQVVLFHTFH